MSSQKGNVKRTRAPKHKNTTAFKNNLHDTTPKIQMLNKLEITNCCARCKDIIDWKIKYKKYKPLTQPKTCTICRQKTVKKAYYVMCDPCAKEKHCCAKCSDKKDIVLQPGLSTAEESKREAMFQLQLGELSEKKRRKFLRLRASGKLTPQQMPSTAGAKLDMESDHESDDEEDYESEDEGENKGLDDKPSDNSMEEGIAGPSVGVERT